MRSRSQMKISRLKSTMAAAMPKYQACAAASAAMWRSKAAGSHRRKGTMKAVSDCTRR